MQRDWTRFADNFDGCQEIIGLGLRTNNLMDAKEPAEKCVQGSDQIADNNFLGCE